MWLVCVGWAVAGLAVWLLVLAIALKWAIDSGLSGQEFLILAIPAASAVTAVLVGVVVLSQRRTRGLLMALAMVAAIVLVGTLASPPSTTANLNQSVPLWWNQCGSAPQWWDYLWPPDHWFAPNAEPGLCGA